MIQSYSICSGNWVSTQDLIYKKFVKAMKRGKVRQRHVGVNEVASMCRRDTVSKWRQVAVCEFTYAQVLRKRKKYSEAKIIHKEIRAVLKKIGLVP